MEAKPSISSDSCSCLSSSSSSSYSGSSKSKYCHKATEFICSACLLCICCPLAIAWCVIKLPCKVGWQTVQYVMHRSCGGSGKRVFAAYSSFSDIDSEMEKGKVEICSKSLGISKIRMTDR